VRVVEMASFIAGPYAGQLLADLGADVVKLERQDGGDPFRSFQGRGAYGLAFVGYNRGKRSLALDLRGDPGALELAIDLLRGADVLLENSRPGVMERLGLDYERVREVNPRIVYCSVSGFGHDGPYAHRPAFDTVGQALSGMLSQLVDPERPRLVGPNFADSVTGLTAALGITAALAARERTGEGQRLEVPMLAATTAFLSVEGVTALLERRNVDPGWRPANSQAYAFRCADGLLLALHLSSPEKFWRSLLVCLEHPPVLDDPRFADRGGRAAHYEELDDILAGLFAQRPRSEWLERLERLDVPHAPVHTPVDVYEDPQAEHVGMVMRQEHPTEGEVLTVTPPFRFGGEPVSGLRPPPALGEHNDEIRAALWGEPTAVPARDDA
jgi:crotonobetainyl-CoA:carnitine CoA-transferase CaiB-like acyl-CoA transferase